MFASRRTHRRTNLTERTVRAGQRAMSGESGRFASYLPFLGPAIIASVAYMDPGNFATNIQAGGQFGYELVWVVVAANLIAMLFQALSAKVGIVTGRSIAELSRERFPRPAVYAMWIGSEVAAMATDVAEFLGAALGLHLLFSLPLLPALGIVGIVTYGILLLQNYGFRPMEIVIGAFVSFIGLCYLVELFIAKQDWALLAYHAVVPHIGNESALLLAVGIVGATVMPHAIYLHSALTKERIPAHSDEERRVVLRFSNHEVLAALGVAGLVNIAMVAMAASVFHMNDPAASVSLESAYRTLAPLLGIGAAGVFLLSLIASGFSSSVVGTMAGQGIMQDFVGFRIPLWLRRLVTMAPSFLVAMAGWDVTHSLIVSQVILSVTLPIPIVAVILFSNDRTLMGAFANGPLMKTAGIVAGAVIVGLNAVLLLGVVGVAVL